MAGTATIVFRRSKRWFALFRRLKVLVDGVESANLWPGEAAELEVASGTHVVQTNMDWCWSNVLEIDCHPGSKPVVVCDSAPLLLAAHFIFVSPSKVFRVFEDKTVDSDREAADRTYGLWSI